MSRWDCPRLGTSRFASKQGAPSLGGGPSEAGNLIPAAFAADLSNAWWKPTNVTVAAAPGPNGTNNAWRLTATTAAATTFRSDNSAPILARKPGAHRFSVYAKQSSAATDANVFLLRNNTTATNLLAVTINYGTGGITYNIGSAGASAVNVGNGWWQITLQAAAFSMNDAIWCYIGFIGNAEGLDEAADFYNPSVVKV